MTLATPHASPNRPSRLDLQEADARHHWHPFTDTAELNAKGARVIVSAEGSWLTDIDGNRILDGMAGLWCVQVGYGRQEIVDAVTEQLKVLPYYNTFFQTTHPPVVQLGEALSEVLPQGMSRVFFTLGGSDAVDTAFRFARLHWQAQGKPEKTILIARTNAYHGSSVAGVAIGGMGAMHGQAGPQMPGIHRIGQPYWFMEGRDQDPAAFGLSRARELEAAIDELGEDKVAAFIAEPIQGAGGVVIPPETYWTEIKRICEERDILFIADEVICGYGRLGAFWGSQHYGIRPDILTMAKGMTSGYLPMGGVGISDKVAEPIIAHSGEFFHGYTYSGHPASAAAALASLKIIRGEGLVERVAEDIGPYLQERWATLSDHPLVGETRMRGLVGALELVRKREPAIELFENRGTTGLKCRDHCFKNGLVMRSVGDAMIISPPLTLSHEEADALVARARKSLDDLADQLTREGAL